MARTYRELNEDLRGQARAAGGRDEADAQEFRLYRARHGRARNRAGLTGSSRRCVNGLILGIHVGHRGLQHDAHRGRRCAEERLPAHGGAGIVRARKTGQGKLCAGGGASGKRFVVEAESDIAGKERRWRRCILLGGHSVSLSPCF